MNVRSINSAASTLWNSINLHKFRAVGCLQFHSSVGSKSSASPRLTSYEEIQISVPWGHVAGKWWGRKDVTPVIGLHGFEDNAGTFDRLAPLLDIPAFFAWDAPGHGRSSHIPKGMVYTFVDFVITLRYIVKHFGWGNISIIGHSFGSCMGHVYSSLYPSDVDRFVSLDCARVFMAAMGSSGQTGLPLLRLQVEKNLKADKDFGKDPPAYKMQDMVDAFCKATSYSVDKEHASPLLERGATVHPTKADHFYFTRDQKLRHSEFNRLDLQVLEEAAKAVKCHVLSILGSNGFLSMASTAGLEVYKSYEQMENHLKNSAASYDRCTVEGTHHVHLNNPEVVAPLINKFFVQ